MPVRARQGRREIGQWQNGFSGRRSQDGGRACAQSAVGRRIMRKHLACSMLPAFSVAALLFFCSASAAGQGQPEPQGINPAGGGVPMRSLEKLKAKSSGPAPRAADGKPDLSGIWGPEPHLIGDIAVALKPGEKLPLQPWALKLTRARLSKDDPNANCLPSGIPR